MTFLVDAQLPPALARFLVEHGHEAAHVQDLGMSDASDTVIWEWAAREDRVLITKDEDFSLRHLRQPIVRVVWIRVGNCTRRALLAWFSPLLPEIMARLAAGDRFIEVV